MSCFCRSTGSFIVITLLGKLRQQFSRLVYGTATNISHLAPSERNWPLIAHT
uniref:Uncharacterized protein n=1 Tax=Timema cristinae TaxID=61476 RepID=A0A7R9DG90_TIMCR|nr:unnamed protein product [Timema cristinae]